MVSLNLNPNPPQTFHFFDPFNMEDQNKKVRKPYTITKSRENWTDQEHDKFLEALHLPDSSSVVRTPVSSVPLPSWVYNVTPPVSLPRVTKDDMVMMSQQINPFSSSNESTPRGWPISKQTDQGDQGKPTIVMPDFAQVYSFIGTVFDPNAINHLQRLKQMDPINVKTVLLLMRNLSTNLRSPEFENERRMLSLYYANMEKEKSSSHRSQPLTDRSESVVLSA
ncbi:hypothetical protein JHK85_052149 [Glycine max]|nr:hypothetical protein JHK85_052149 [Glycine max]